MTEGRRETAFVERRSGTDRRTSNWREAVDRLTPQTIELRLAHAARILEAHRALVAALVTLEAELREAVCDNCDAGIDQWADRIAALIRNESDK